MSPDIVIELPMALAPIAGDVDAKEEAVDRIAAAAKAAVGERGNRRSAGRGTLMTYIRCAVDVAA